MQGHNGVFYKKIYILKHKNIQHKNKKTTIPASITTFKVCVLSIQIVTTQ